MIDPDVLWSCVTCGACVEQCPVDIEHVDHIVDMRRYQVMMESEFPSELSTLFKNLETKGNPWGQNAGDRTNWIDEVDFDVPVYGEDVDSFDGYEYLFWVGCAGAYDDKAKKTTKAVAELLAVAGVKYLVLGTGETCNGDSARRSGNEFLFQQLAQQAVETLDGLFEGVETRRPQDRRHLPALLQHPGQANTGSWAPTTRCCTTPSCSTGWCATRSWCRSPLFPKTSPITTRATWAGTTRCTRRRAELIGAAGANLTEMPRHAERSFCCGAGGARMWMEEHIGKRINHERVDEALATGAATIATGCPFCRVMVTDGVNDRRKRPVAAASRCSTWPRCCWGRSTVRQGEAAGEGHGRERRQPRLSRQGRAQGCRRCPSRTGSGTRQGAKRPRPPGCCAGDGHQGASPVWVSPAAPRNPGAKKAAPHGPAHGRGARRARHRDEGQRLPPRPSRGWASPPAPSGPAPRRQRRRRQATEAEAASDSGTPKRQPGSQGARGARRTGQGPGYRRRRQATRRQESRAEGPGSEAKAPKPRQPKPGLPSSNRKPQPEPTTEPEPSKQTDGDEHRRRHPLKGWASRAAPVHRASADRRI